MKITIIKPDELCEVMQHLNLLKVKFNSKDAWIVAPMLFATEESVDIIVNSENAGELQVGESVILKFQRFGYEYIVSGESVNVSAESPTVVSIKLNMAQRYFNLRKHIRYETNLKVILKTNDEQCIESTVKNISRGGAMVVSKADIEMNSIIGIQITFKSQNSFTAIAKVLRRSPDNEKGFSYGIQFIEVTEDNSKIFNKEIMKYEKEYLKTLDILKEYTSQESSYIDTKITILCYDAEESYGIRELLVKMGAENFGVFHNFSFYYDFFVEENPKVVIIDAECLKTDISDMIHEINTSFPKIKIMLLLPLSAMEAEAECKHIPDEVSVLYKPLVYNEFESEIIKYL